MKKNIGVACVFVIFSVSLFLSHLYVSNSLPHGLHAWAQADRYAIAANYLNEDRSFFNPATYSIMSDNGNTGVEFPLLAYLSGKLGHSPSDVASWFRWLSALVVVLSVTAFSLLTFPERVLWHHFLPYTLLLGSSTFLFYSFSFIPDSTSLGFTLVGIGFSIAFHRKRITSLGLVAVCLFTLAALTKVSAGMYLLLFGFGVVIRRRQFSTKSVVALLTSTMIGLIAVGLYDYFLVYEKNKELWAVVFMSSPNALTFQDLTKSFKDAAYWFPQVLSFYVVPLITLLVFLGLRKVWFQFTGIERWLIFGVPMIGFSAFWMLFGRQFGHHDYYWLASYLPAVFALAWFGSNQSFRKPMWILPLIGLALWGMVDAAQRSNRAHNDEFDYRKGTIVNRTKWMTDGMRALDSIGIDKSATVFVLYDFAPNLTLSHFNRKGIVFNHEQMARNQEHINYWVDRVNPDYFIIRKKWMSHFQKDQPELHSKIDWRHEFDHFLVGLDRELSY